ncbi:MAG: glycoside hydrolase family 3 protein [Hyphomicrobiaceae bacterium]
MNTLTQICVAGVALFLQAGLTSAGAETATQTVGSSQSIPSYSQPPKPRQLTPVEQARRIANQILRGAKPRQRHAEAANHSQNAQRSSPQKATLDRMIGQMIMVGFHGTSTKSRDVARTVAAIRSGKVGGVVLLGYNLKSSSQLKDLTGDLKSAAAGHLPPFIGLDQEGGLVQRLGPKQGLRKYPSAARIAKTETPQQAQAVYSNMAGDLARHGINLNFGPVVDLGVNKRNPVIYKPGRSYSALPKRVADYAGAFIDAHAKNGVLTAAKHFPGHGSSNSDSHKGFVDITKTWSEIELAPYRALASSGKLDMVMVGHLFHERLAGTTGQRHPATLSDGIINGLLRKELGFNGVVITDDFYMAAISKHYKLEDSFVRAINAGNDIIMLTGIAGRSANPARLHKILRSAVDAGRISHDRVRQSYDRIVRLKRELYARQHRARARRAEK